MIIPQRAPLLQVIQPSQRSVHLARHGEGDRSVQLQHRARISREQSAVQMMDLGPVGFGGSCGLRIKRGDRGLQLVGAGAALRHRLLNQPEPLSDARPIPAATILLLQRNQIAVDVDPRVPARVVEQHQRQQSAHFRLTRQQPNQGTVLVTDGPFAETREQLGGYYLINVPDQETAIEWAKKCPGVLHGKVEVRALTGNDGGGQ